MHKYTLRMPVTSHDTLAKLAKKENTSLNNWIVTTLEREVEYQEHREEIGACDD
jgi:predicted HicB family RNase H-like nuclease